MLVAICLVILPYLPNHDYYRFLRHSDAAQQTQTLHTLIAYGSMELLSFVAINLLIWRKLRISLVHQLAFVLESHVVNIQSKFWGWITIIIMNSLIQCGESSTFPVDLTATH